MPGRGRGAGHGKAPGQGRAGKNDGGVDTGVPQDHGRSDWAPGHLKRESGAQSARDYAPGHGGQAPV